MTRFETLDADWLSIHDAVDRVLSHAAPLPAEEIALPEVGGRALARDLEARVTLPPWDNSAMDGYAVRSSDVTGASEDRPVELPVAAVIRAGDQAPGELEEGTAVRIMTGAPVPRGADGVVRVEDTDAEEASDGRVRIFSDRDAGRHVRPAGRDAREGETILEQGDSLGGGQVAVLASQGYARVPVHRRPRVAILPNGDELAELADFDRVRAGEAVPESNGPALAEAARAAGALPTVLPIAVDEPESILVRLDDARDADALVTIGGASMGEADLLKRVLARRGYEPDFWRVKIRPGSPFGLGFLPGGDRPLPVFGLPGNPGSAYVTFQLFVRPFLLALAGHRRMHRPVVRARAGSDLSSPARLTHLFRVTLEESDGGDPAAPGWTALLTGAQGSGLVQSVGRAEGLAVVPEGTEKVAAGELVSVILLGDGPGWRTRPGY